MSKKQYKWMNILLILMGVVLLFELGRDSFKSGDFIGYVNAGNAVINGTNIYSDYLNTWPPFFSVFSVPLAAGDRISPVFIRFVWLTASIAWLFWIVNLTTQLILGKSLSWRRSQEGIPIQEPIIVIPFLIMMRYTMDNLANVQINIFMLLLALLSVKAFTQKKYLIAGLLLGFTISLKVFTIFFLFYFIFKREFKMVGWTLVSILACNLITLGVFGIDQGIEYFQVWVDEVAPKSYGSHHKNQSVFGAFLRLFTSMQPGHDLYFNITDISPKTVRKATYLAVALASIYPAFIFRDKIKNALSWKSILQYSLIFTAIPVLSPVAWKAYFIFLWIPYFVIYYMLYRAKNNMSKSGMKKLRFFFWLSLVLNVFTTELFTGPYLADVLEALSSITIGSILLILVQIVLFKKLDRFDFEGTVLKGRPKKG